MEYTINGVIGGHFHNVRKRVDMDRESEIETAKSAHCDPEHVPGFQKKKHPVITKLVPVKNFISNSCVYNF